jgi:hypothetical protein
MEVTPEWSLLLPDTLLHLLTPPIEDQNVLLQIIAQETPLNEATDIWDAWATALARPDDPSIPIGFQQSAVAILTSFFTDPAALYGQINDLATWARASIPTRVFTVAVQDDLEEEEMAWYPPLTSMCCRSASPNSVLPHNNYTL